MSEEGQSADSSIAPFPLSSQGHSNARTHGLPQGMRQTEPERLLPIKPLPEWGELVARCPHRRAYDAFLRSQTPENYERLAPAMEPHQRALAKALIATRYARGVESIR